MACAPCPSPSGGSRLSSQVMTGKRNVVVAVFHLSEPQLCACVTVGKPKRGVIYPATLDYIPSRPTYVKTSERSRLMVPWDVNL